MNQNIENQKEFLEILGKLISKSGLSDQERDEVFKNLERSTILNFINRASDSLSIEERSELSNYMNDVDGLMSYLETKISKDRLADLFSQSANEVLDKFIDKL